MKLGRRLILIPVVGLLSVYLLFVLSRDLIYIKSLVIERLLKNEVDLKLLTVKGVSSKYVMKAYSKSFNSKTSKTMTSPSANNSNTSFNKFKQLHKYSVFNPNFRLYTEWPPFFSLPEHNPTLADVWNIQITDDMPNWKQFQLQISKYYLYEDTPMIKDLLQDIATEKIVAVEQSTKGSQLKLVITFENGGKALFKPMRFPREVETLPNHFVWSDYERHVSEIASFHLDRLLGFRRVPPVVGRTVNITEDLYALAPPKLYKTFFVSPAGNVCFHGQCSYYCDTSHAICGKPDTLEGSFAAFIPEKNILERKPLRNPWRRSYNKHRRAEWEGNDNYCIEQVKPTAPYNYGRRLYDAMDTTIFDFLTGNMDRHHYEEITTFGRDSSFIHLDQGRGFGRASHDEMSILTPLQQCCVIRLSTFNRLFAFNLGPRHLSDMMRDSMADDPVAPVLLENHLLALDRRVDKVLETILQCLTLNTPDKVFLDDM